MASCGSHDDRQRFSLPYSGRPATRQTGIVQRGGLDRVAHDLELVEFYPIERGLIDALADPTVAGPGSCKSGELKNHDHENDDDQNTDDRSDDTVRSGNYPV